MKIQLDTDKLFELAAALPEALAGVPLPESVSKWLPVLARMAPMASKLVGQGSSIEGLDAGPRGEGARRYARARSSFSDAAIAEAVGVVIHGQQPVSEPFERAIEYTLGAQGSPSLYGDLEPSDAQIRAALEKVLEGGSLSPQDTVAAGDLLWFALTKKKK